MARAPRASSRPPRISGARSAAPYESAAARLLLGQALTAAGHGARGNAETAAARATFDRLIAIAAADGLCLVSPAREVRAGSTATEHRSVAKATTGRSRSTAAPAACATRRACGISRGCSAQSGREFHALDLVIEEQRAASSARARSRPEGRSRKLSSDAGEVLDRRAKEAYRRRLAEIECDPGRGAPMRRRASNRAGHGRTAFPRARARAGCWTRRTRSPCRSNAERARASVTLALRRAMARVRAANPALGTHLDRTIRTGTFCVYLPDPRVPVDWRVS